MKKIFVLMAIFTTLSPTELLAAPNNIVKLAITLVTGSAAAASAANASEAKAVYQEKDAVVEKLKAQGIDPTDGAIYSAYFQLHESPFHCRQASPPAQRGGQAHHPSCPSPSSHLLKS